MVEEQTSPVIGAVMATQEMVGFSEAINLIMAGKKVNRTSWPDQSVYCFMQAEVLHVKNDKGVHVWSVSKADILGQDWVTVE